MSGKSQIGAKSNSSGNSAKAGILQRKCACGNRTIAGGECGACSNEPRNTLQRAAINGEPKGGQGIGGVPSIVHEVLRSPGQPLDAATRSFMEPRFGHDFSRVRVHTDAHAAESARDVKALAYTFGNDVVFNTGRFAPHTAAGKMLLAHELTHVVQQRGGNAIAHSGHGSSQRYEREADQVASAIVRGGGSSAHGGTAAGPISSLSPTQESGLQRFEEEEHRALGNEASGTAVVNIGGDTPNTKLELEFGDVVMLSADWFDPDELRRLAAIPGNQGKQVGTRDEIIYALYRINARDPRFSANGVWASYKINFLPESKVVTVVNERFDTLAAKNASHFAAPRGRDATGKPLPAAESAGGSYRRLHESALDMAYQAGLNKGDVSQAMGREAAAQHFLSDAFSAGHVRTPIAQMREYWGSIYPLFWYNLLHKMALEVAAYINADDTNAATIFGSVQTIYETVLGEIIVKTKNLPQIGLGDLLAKIFHDYDNENGLDIGGGKKVFGDSHLDDPNPSNVTRQIAVEAMRAGIQDVREAFKIGQAGPTLDSQALYNGVKSATGAPPDSYVAETKLPQPGPGVPAQNWKAPNFETLWNQKVTGPSSPSISTEIIAALKPGKSVRSQLDKLTKEFKVVQDVKKAGIYLGQIHPQRAYVKGFVEPLAANPYQGILSIINWAPNYGLHSTDRDDVSLDTGQELLKQRRLGGMTTVARSRYVRELIDDWVAPDEEALVVSIFRTASPDQRPLLYQMVEGHAWTGDWIEGFFISDDDIWNALNKTNLARLKILINEGWRGKKK